MGYEIDILAVGEKSSGGDAIALRYGNLSGGRSEQFVAVIDGGTLDSGKRLVELVRQRYCTETVDLVVSTHPDTDHISGLREVINELEVRELWMHTPWNSDSELRAAIRGSSSRFRLSEKVQVSFVQAEELEDLALEKGVPVFEPFQGLSDATGALTVLGPTNIFYSELIRDVEINSLYHAGKRLLAELKERVKGFVAETFHVETLSDSGETSARNNSSAILLFRHDDGMILFTADAGVPALNLALDCCELLEIDLAMIKTMQVPHHGSRRNVGPTLLNRLVGPRLDSDASIKIAFLSAPKEGDPKRPSRRVMNAFYRRGARVVSTQGKDLYLCRDAPSRSDYVAAQPMSFYYEVEDDPQE